MTKSKPKALVLTNALHQWAGSEVLAIEVAEELTGMGYSTTICANAIAEEFYFYTLSLGLTSTDQPSEIDLLSFNFIWSQHTVAPLCAGFNKLEQHTGVFVSAHLSPFEVFELVSLGQLSGLCNALVTNSAETENKVKQIAGVDTPISTFYNAAPPSFKRLASLATKKAHPEKILVVSSHIPSELEAALAYLEQSGLDITVYGEGQANYARVLPENFESIDCVVSIGKTVQYGVLSRTPVYCYDHFGGPGWISEENYEVASHFNFSGRCCYTKKDPDIIFSEILQGYEKARNCVDVLYDQLHEKFDLNLFIKALMNENRKIDFKVDVKEISRAQAEIIRRLYRDIVGHRKIK